MVGFGVSTWQVLIWYHLKFISTFSLLLLLKLLFSQHTHLPSWHSPALSLRKQEQSSQSPPPRPGTPRQPPRSCHSALRLASNSPCLCSQRCFAFFVVGVMSVPPALPPMSSHFPRQLFENENTALGSWLFIPVASSSLLKVVCLTTELESQFLEGGWGMRKRKQALSQEC